MFCFSNVNLSGNGGCGRELPTVPHVIPALTFRSNPNNRVAM